MKSLAVEGPLAFLDIRASALQCATKLGGRHDRTLFLPRILVVGVDQSLLGHPGVGKLTVAELLRERLAARLLDNHSVYNIALSLTEFKSEIYFDTIRAVREIAYDRIADLPRDIPVILTNAHFQGSTWGDGSWDRVASLARDREVPLLIVALRCSKPEIERRIQGQSRQGKRKPRSLDVFPSGSASRPIIDRGEHVLHLDTTSLSAESAAERIEAWVHETIAGRVNA